VNAATLQSLLHITDQTISATDAENIIDQAIDQANGYLQLAMSNMSGTAGSKTVALTSAQRGLVMGVAMSLYYRRYRDPTTTGVGGINSSAPPIQDAETILIHAYPFRASYLKVI